MKKLFTLLVLIISFIAYAQDEINIDGNPCGMHGSSKPGTKEYDQNLLKNRYNFPQASDFDTNLSLKDFVNGSAVEGKFSSSKAVEVTGYVYNVKVGGIETCNCKTKDQLFRDTHIELTLNDKQTGPENRFIVEVTPRIRQIMANKGIDWTTATLKKTLKGHMVKIQGWLFYDASHKTEDFADDPDDNIGRANWRATAWEVHPITNIEIMDETESVTAASNDNEGEITPVNIFSGPGKSSTLNKANNMETTPSNILILIVLGAILGMVGQGLRVIVGIKKVNDEAATNKTVDEQKELFKAQRLVLSLIIAFAVGAVAGVLAAVTSTEVAFSKSLIFAFIAAGYAGTDFIEGFMKKNPTVTQGKV